MKIDTTLQRLEALSLLGAGWVQAADALTTLRGEVSKASNQAVLRVILLDAGLRMASPAEDPVPFLSSAERWARSQDLTQGALLLRLLWCQHVGRVDPHAVPDRVLAESVAQAQQSGGLEAEWRTALAVGHLDNIRLLNEALPHLEEPRHAHQRLQVLEDLAAARLDGGDVPAAVQHLSDALALADAHEAHDASLRVISMLAQLRLVQGMHDKAKPFLQRALALAQVENDDLALLTQASLLAGLHLHAEQWTDADAAAAIQIPAALRRGNWMAVADGSITRSTSALHREDPASAVRILVSCSQEMKGQAPTGAGNLVHARLVELRAQMGAEVFDPLLTAAIDRA